MRVDRGLSPRGHSQERDGRASLRQERQLFAMTGTDRRWTGASHVRFMNVGARHVGGGTSDRSTGSVPWQNDRSPLISRLNVSGWGISDGTHRRTTRQSTGHALKA